jgi:hypothetical protein
MPCSMSAWAAEARVRLGATVPPLVPDRQHPSTAPLTTSRILTRPDSGTLRQARRHLRRPHRRCHRYRGHLQDPPRDPHPRGRRVRPPLPRPRPAPAVPEGPALRPGRPRRGQGPTADGSEPAPDRHGRGRPSHRRRPRRVEQSRRERTIRRTPGGLPGLRRAPRPTGPPWLPRAITARSSPVSPARPSSHPSGSRHIDAHGEVRSPSGFPPGHHFCDPSHRPSERSAEPARRRIPTPRTAAPFTRPATSTLVVP